MSALSIALYQPDIAGNTGTIIRLAACLGLSVEIIEPAGFDLSDRNLRRAGLDYIETAKVTRHTDWKQFEIWRRQTGRRLILASTKASVDYVDFRFIAGDVLLFGRESAGVPDHVHETGRRPRVRIDMVEGRRSLNLAMSVAMITGEAVRQARRN